MDLLQKYNVPGPRYTSYPTVPYWSDENFSVAQWESLVVDSFNASNKGGGISLYVHLPYCESLCTYCGCNTRITVNHAVEGPYVDNILKEWDMYLALLDEPPVIRELHLGGGTPTFFSARNLERLIKGITEKAIVPDKTAFGFEAHPRNTTKKHLNTLYNLGFTRLSLGIQDFNSTVQKAINRIQSEDDVLEVTQMARDIGYTSINLDLIYGLPHQSMETILDTLSKVNELRPDRIAFYSYAHVPWLKPGQRGYSEADLPADANKRALYEAGKKSFENAGYVEIGMDHFALREDELAIAFNNGTLHRNFMGYTPYATKLAIGLGVSAISDSWTGFAQNVKVVEEYNRLLEAGKLPVFRGHVLNTEDLVLRRHILNLMCGFTTDWSNPHEKCDFVHEAVDQLSEMETDALVSISEGRIDVTNEGRPFVRNVCMAFDARLKRNKPETQVFSSTI